MNLGLLDLPSPLFALWDQALGFVPGILRLALWALLSAIATMWLYRVFSKQGRLAELKPEIKATQRDMARYDGPLSGLWPLIGKSMKLSGRQMGLTLWPALIASLPVLFVLVYLSNAYGYRLPAVGETIIVTPEGAESPGDWHWQSAPSARFDADSGAWRVRWPEHTARLMAPGHGAVLTLPMAMPATIVHKRQWWNWLMGNPVDYLAEEAPLQALHIGLERERYLAFGPDWMGYWEFIYLALLVVFSLAIKSYWKIH